MRQLALMALSALLWQAASAARAETIYAAVTVNGYDTGLIVSFDRQGERFTATAEDLDHIGLVVPRALAQRSGAQIDLGSLPGVHFAFQADKQLLAIEAVEASLKTHLIGNRPVTGPPDEAAYGALINYGLAASAATRGSIQASGNLEFRAFGPPGIIDSDWYFGPAAGRGSAFRRLDTALIHDDPQSLRTWTAGDFITASLPWSRPVRGVGFSLATDFSIRPDLITQPMPWLRGSASVPSTIDLYLDGVHQLSEQAPAGPFSVSQVPTVNGEGEVSLAVTDALGRQTVQTFSFYATNQLLAPGLTSYAVEGGWLREDFGEMDDRYTKAFAQGLVRHGMNDWLTLEGRAATTAGVAELGAGLVAKLGEFAVLDLSYDDSSLGGRDGRQLRASLERQAGPYFLFAAAAQSMGDFRDVASAAGDPPVRRSLQIGAGWNSDRFGTFGMNYYEQRVARRGLDTTGRSLSDDIDILAASWVYPLSKGWTVHASAFHSVAGNDTFGFMIGVTISPSDGLIVDGGMNQNANRVGAYVDASQTPPTDGGWGWSAQAQSAPSANAQGTVRYVSRIGEVGAGVSAGYGSAVGSVYAAGAAVWMAGGNPRLARQSSVSFAEVDTEKSGVGITLENREMGKTDSDGRLFVPDLIPFNPNHFAVEPDTVPLSDEIVVPAAVTRPPRNAGVIVHLPVRPNLSAAVRFVGTDGAPLPLNASVMLNGKAQSSIGYDGVAWLSGLAADNRVAIGEDGHACIATFQVTPSMLESGLEIGPVTCVPP
jgi:outer membrane usher protein